MLDASEWARSSQPIIKHNVGRRDALDVINFKAALYQKTRHFVQWGPVNVKHGTRNPNAPRENVALQKQWGIVSNGAQTGPEKLPSDFCSSKIILPSPSEPLVGEVFDFVRRQHKNQRFHFRVRWLTLSGIYKMCDVNTFLD